MNAFCVLYVISELECFILVLCEISSWLSSTIVIFCFQGQLDAESLELLMRECASAMLAAGMNARAVSMLEELRRRHPKDLRVLAQLITAYATVDPVAAQKV